MHLKYEGQEGKCLVIGMSRKGEGGNGEDGGR
jgi:hypothetical protein